MKARVLGLLGSLLLPLLAAGADWQHHATLHGAVFEKVRTTNEGRIIGILAHDQTIAGRSCRRGWVHLHPNGVPALFESGAPIPLRAVTIPPDSWVRQDATGVVVHCSFPTDTLVQGYLCRGTGGSKGVQTSFHPDGTLKQFFPAQPLSIDGVPCDHSLMRGWVDLHPDGRLKSCRLREPWMQAGRRFPSGLRLEFDPVGRVLTPPPPGAEPSPDPATTGETRRDTNETGPAPAGRRLTDR